MVIGVVLLYITAISYYTYSLPEACCHWLQTCNVAMAMVVVGYTCVQSFVVMHPTIV